MSNEMDEFQKIVELMKSFFLKMEEIHEATMKLEKEVRS